MKKQILTIALLLCAYTIVAQTENAKEQELKHIVNAENWGSEFFDFPIRFAQEIPYKGYEEAVFSPGWSNQKSDEFWSYVFAWQIEASAPLTSTDFEKNLDLYFDGLMDIKNRENNTTIFATKTMMSEGQKIHDTQHYFGNIRLFEGRYTNKMMTLHVLAEQHFCEETQESIIIFRFSPKPFKEAIWEDLKNVTLNIGEDCK